MCSRTTSIPASPIAVEESADGNSAAAGGGLSGFWRLGVIPKLRPFRCRASLHSILIVAFAWTHALASPTQPLVHDPPCDAVPRLTDPGADGVFDPGMHRLPELLTLRIGTWTATDPQIDLFAGVFDAGGGFVRIDIRLLGLMNPPGSVDPLDFSPFAYGANPVFGFIEVDIDGDNQTGGELEAPQFRYNGNVVRFGGVPSGSQFEGRIAMDESAFDGIFLTEPLVDQSGEEFHIALTGENLSPSNIAFVEGDTDLTFEEGETWHIQAPWFHRAHGYEGFSFAKGGSVPGEYAPVSHMQFQHQDEAGVTMVSLVFPLTNEAAGAMAGQPAEPLNHNPTDQASILEALNDLVVSASFLDAFPSGLPEEDIIIRWKSKNPLDFMDPADWDATILLGSSYEAADPSGALYVWSDVAPNPVAGDVNGDGLTNDLDEGPVENYILLNDSVDGIVDGSAAVPAFAGGFTAFDVNYDGAVDAGDTEIAEHGVIPACIPAISQWGVIVLTLLLACVGTVAFFSDRRQGRARPS